MAAPAYTAKSPAESRAIMRALDAGTPARTVVRTLLGTPDHNETLPATVKAPARVSRAVSGPTLRRAAGAVQSVIGVPAQMAQAPSDSALSRLFTAVVVGAIVLELASLASGKFFTVSTGGQSPFPLQISGTAQQKTQAPAPATLPAGAAAALTGA